MTDKQPYLQAATDPAVRASSPPLTFSQHLQANLTQCHLVLNVLGVPKFDERYGIDNHLRERLAWLARQDVRILSDIEDYNDGA